MITWISLSKKFKNIRPSNSWILYSDWAICPSFNQVLGTVRKNLAYYPGKLYPVPSNAGIQRHFFLKSIIWLWLSLVTIIIIISTFAIWCTFLNNAWWSPKISSPFEGGPHPPACGSLRCSCHSLPCPMLWGCYTSGIWGYLLWSFQSASYT